MLRNEYKQAKTKYVLKLTTYLKCTIRSICRSDSSKLNKQSVLRCSITFQKQQNFESNAFFLDINIK